MVDSIKAEAESSAAAITDKVTPKRSIIRPMIRFPSAKPSMFIVKGKEVTDRLVTNSASKAGIIVMTAHMPVFAKIAMISVITNRNQE